MSTAELPLVLVLVGTDHHPFDRVVDWTDLWLAGRHATPVRCLVQHGTSKAPMLAEASPYLDHRRLDDLIGAARVVVSHGGPTTISEARRHGHLPLVVPRRSAGGEHVDDHQVRFSTRLARAGMIQLLESQEQFSTAIETVLSFGPAGAGATDPVDSGPAARSFGQLVDRLLVRR